MLSLEPHITFNGNCSEAMRFYRSCFGGELHITYLKDTISPQRLCIRMMTMVVQATLETAFFTLHGSDLSANNKSETSKKIGLLLDVSSDEDLPYALAAGSGSEDEIRCWNKNEWISFTDRYGVHWILKN